jgi:hypothetical protein
VRTIRLPTCPSMLFKLLDMVCFSMSQMLADMVRAIREGIHPVKIPLPTPNKVLQPVITNLL